MKLTQEQEAIQELQELIKVAQNAITVIRFSQLVDDPKYRSAPYDFIIGPFGIKRLTGISHNTNETQQTRV